MFLGNKRKLGNGIMDAIRVSAQPRPGGDTGNGEASQMKKRWRRGLSVLLTAVLLLSVPGVLELTAAAVERMGTAIQAADGGSGPLCDTSRRRCCFALPDIAGDEYDLYSRQRGSVKRDL